MKKIACVMMSLVLVCASGCRSSECSAMSACCGAVQGLDGMEGLGEACGPLAAQTTNPDSCRSVTETVRYMLKDRKQPIPTSCQ